MGNNAQITPKNLLISRTDSIGDVMLTLPITSWIKTQFPSCKITFLCKDYTAPLVSMYAHVDEILSWDSIQQMDLKSQIKAIAAYQFDSVIHVFPRKEIATLMKQVKIPTRIGTSHRLFHFFTCNEKVHFTRKNSPLHEAQLNFELLRPFGLQEIPPLADINNYTTIFKSPTVELPDFLNPLKATKYVVLHPKSQGSAKEWPIEKYTQLAKYLSETGITVVFTGTEKEGQLFRNQLPKSNNIFDSSGKLSIQQLCLLIQHAFALVACSTGPLHIAGYSGIRTIGLFSPKKPIHPGRWMPLGKHVHTLVLNENCSNCQSGKPCDCISEIPVEQVFNEITK